MRDFIDDDSDESKDTSSSSSSPSEDDDDVVCLSGGETSSKRKKAAIPARKTRSNRDVSPGEKTILSRGGYHPVENQTHFSLSSIFLQNLNQLFNRLRKKNGGKHTYKTLTWRI